MKKILSIVLVLAALLTGLIIFGGCSKSNQEKMNALLDEYVNTNNQTYLVDVVDIANKILLSRQGPITQISTDEEDYHFDKKLAEILIKREKFNELIMLYNISSYKYSDQFITDDLFLIMNNSYKGDDPGINYFIAHGLKSYNHLKSSYYRASKAAIKDPGSYGDDIVGLLDHYGCSFEADVWKEFSSTGGPNLLPDNFGEKYPRQPNKRIEEILAARKQIRFGHIPDLTDNCPLVQYD